MFREHELNILAKVVYRAAYTDPEGINSNTRLQILEKSWDGNLNK